MIATSAIAAVGARPYAGSWNDGSRLAAAESLVDRGTWAIDHSIFVAPESRPAGAPPPYPVRDRLLSTRGTLDRLFIDGQFVSDKTPVSSLLLAGVYWVVQHVAGIVARVEADRFSYWLTLVFAGASFVVSSAAMFLLAWRVSGSPAAASLVSASFSLATCAAAYSRHVNGHEPLLAIFALLMLQIDGVAREGARRSSIARSVAAGTLAGVGYGLDAALGPLALVLVVVFFLCVSPSRAWVVLVAASPWVALQHALNYHIGHTLMPPNSVAAYLSWPGSPFSARTMTGVYNHESIGHALIYSIDLLVGRRGFLLHNLPLLLVPFAIWRVMRRHREIDEWPAAAFAVALGLGGWLIYAVGSTNHGGVALSVRWFVPLLAPLFYLLALDLRIMPSDRMPFVLLTAAGLGMAIAAWTGGPWQPRVPWFWLWLSIALVSCVGWLIGRGRIRRGGHHAGGSVTRQSF